MIDLLIASFVWLPAVLFYVLMIFFIHDEYGQRISNFLYELKPKKKRIQPTEARIQNVILKVGVKLKLLDSSGKATVSGEVVSLTFDGDNEFIGIYLRESNTSVGWIHKNVLELYTLRIQESSIPWL